MANSDCLKSANNFGGPYVVQKYSKYFYGGNCPLWGAFQLLHDCPALVEGPSGALPHPCGQWPLHLRLGAAQWLLWGHLVHDIWFVSFCKGAGKFEWWPHPKPMVAAHPFQLTPPKWGCAGKSMARAREPDGARPNKPRTISAGVRIDF